MTRPLPKRLRWFGFSSAAVALVLNLLLPVKEMVNEPTTIVVLVPAVTAGVLCFTRWLWLLLIPGLWFLFEALMMLFKTSPPTYAPPPWAAALLCAAVAMVLVPVIAWVIRMSEDF